MQKYLLIDAMNLFYRATNVVNKSSGVDMMIGMSFHIILNSIKRAYMDWGITHCVLCLEGNSFRKSIYPPYKAQRVAARMAKTEQERETDQILLEAFRDFCDFFVEKTNVTVLQAPNSEADDLIATWVSLHDNDQNIILSADQDYYQLITKNVSVYNAISRTLITDEGFFDEKGKPVIDKKTKKAKEPVDPGYFLFEKIIRGDTSDNISSAYPGVRKKSTKNATGIIEAYEDMDKGGFAWNNFMLQKWTDIDDVTHTVYDRYKLNKSLIDLTDQPDHIKEECVEAIINAINRKPVQNIGIHFMKFCGRHDLVNISKAPTSVISALINTYKGPLKDIEL